MKNSTGGVYFEASREGDELHVILIEPGADGRPDYTRGRELTFTPDGSAPSVGAAASAPAAPAAPSARENPMAAGARGTADPFSGTFTGSDVSLTLRKTGASYTGTITYQGQQFPATATTSGATLNGKFTAQGSQFDFTVEQASANVVNLSTAGTTYMLQKSGAPARAANPLAGASGNAQAGSAPAAGGSTALATTAQDQQIARLLLSSAWCSFSYSGGSTYSGGSYGTTRTTRAVFSQDGTVRQTSGGESTNSGANGSVYGSSQGGDAAYWKVQNGQLMLSTDRVNWAPQPLEISQNSNGYPIVKANGTEYMTCR
jgi:hypothetical protein